MSGGPDRGTRRRERLLPVAGVYAVLTALALAAWFTVGDTAWTQPVNLFTFWWALPGVPLALLALALRSRRSAALLAVPALLWMWSYGTAFVPEADQQRPAGALRIASFNIDVNAPDISHVVRLVRQQRPDVLVLQEVFGEREQILRDRFARRYPHVEAVQSPGVGALLVLSRDPIIDVASVGGGSERSRQTAVVELELDGGRLQVVPVHLLSPCPTCGTSLLERLELEGDVRRAEMGAILDALDPDVPAVVAGDFNSTERSAPYRRLVAAGFEDPQRTAGRGMGFTWPNDGPLGAWLRIDWIMTRGLRPIDARVTDGGPSDHRPVVIDVVPDGRRDTRAAGEHVVAEASAGG